MLFVVEEEEEAVLAAVVVVGGRRMTLPPLFSHLPAPALFLPLFYYRLSSGALRFSLSDLSSMNVSHNLGLASLLCDGNPLNYRPTDVSRSYGRFRASLSSRRLSTLSP